MRQLERLGVPAIHLLWFLIALTVLPNGGHFLLDEAVFFHQAISASRGDWFPTLGPMISGTHPLAFTPGGAFALILAPFFWLSSDPRAGVIGIMMLSCLGGVLWDRVLIRQGETRLRVRLGVAAILAFLPWHARMSDRIWNVQLFSFLTPLFFYSALRLAGSRARREGLLWGALTGAAFSACLQIHLGATGLAFVALGLLADPENRRHWLIRIVPISGGILLGMGLLYLPYLLREAAHSWENTSRLLDGPQTAQGWTDVLQATLAPLRFVNFLRFDWDTEKLQFDQATLSDWVTLLLGGAFFLTSFKGRPTAVTPVVLSLVWLPFFFTTSGRTFYPHYVASFAPLWMFSAARGALQLSEGFRSEVARKAAWISLALFTAMGTARWVEHYGRRAWGYERIPTIPLLLQQSREQNQYFARKLPALFSQPSPGAELRLPYLEQNPVISMLQASILSWVDGKAPIFIRGYQTGENSLASECQIHFPLPGRPALDSIPSEPRTSTSPLYYESVLTCRPLSAKN